MSNLPKPKALRLIQGNPGKRPIRADEPDGAPGVPVCPSFLGKPGKDEWYRLSGLLDGEGRLTLSDGPTLDGAARSREAALSLDRRLKRGKLSLSERLSVQRAAGQHWDAYRKFVNDLCLSAGTRARASVTTKEKASKAEAFGAKKPSAT